jgi:hypothetical protein
MMMSGAWRVAADLSLSWWKSISSGLHVAATVWCGVSAMSGGFQVQVGGVQAADVSPSSSSFVGVVGGVVMGVSGKRQASVLLLELLVVVHHRPSSSVESWLPAVGDGIRMVDDRSAEGMSERSTVGSMGMGSASVGCGWSVTRKNSA